MNIALKIDVDTLRGTLEGIPRLLHLLEKYQAKATFLLSLGPDRTGRAIRRVFRRGFLKKVSRTSVIQHYGFPTLLYGVLWPGPDIGKRAVASLRSVQSAGFEIGIHTWDHTAWQDGVGNGTHYADDDWTQEQMQLAQDRFQEIFGVSATVHGAAGWQMNPHAFRLTQQFGFLYASDTRGQFPFIPIVNGELIHCPQLPTTLPTLDELIGREGLSERNVHQAILAESRIEHPETGHVHTIHAELEGGALLSSFEHLLQGWRAEGYNIIDLRTLRDSLSMEQIPRHQVIWGEVPGRSGTLAQQGTRWKDCLEKSSSLELTH